MNNDYAQNNYKLLENIYFSSENKRKYSHTVVNFKILSNTIER